MATTTTFPPNRAQSRRGGPFRFLIWVLAITVALAAGGLLYIDSQLEDVGALESLAQHETLETFLIIGSDSRENLPDDLAGNFGDFAGGRADVIILAHVVGGHLQLLSLPRDLKVNIPGTGTDRINAAYAYGGPDLMVATVTEATGIPIHRYLEVDFGGFASIVDAVGGVELNFEYPARDLKSGLEVEAGSRRVDGGTALAYARSRNYQELRDGEWENADGGDLARTGRQREVLIGILKQATNPSNLLRLPGLAGSVGASLAIDHDSAAWNLVPLAWAGRTGDQETVVLPVSGIEEGGVSYLLMDDWGPGVIEAFIEGRPLPIPEDG